MAMSSSPTASVTFVPFSDSSGIMTVHVEVLLHPNCLLDKETVKQACSKIVWNTPIVRGENIHIKDFTDAILKKNVLSMLVSAENKLEGRIFILSPENCKLVFHLYSLNTEGPESFEFGPENANSEAATHWSLPSSDFHMLWENLIFDSEIKMKLLNYVSSTLLFAERQVDVNIVPWNKVVLLHGPPGTGKTSLCKALAQKICIRFEEKYQLGHLLEINSHSLFSKFFSESGKLVTKLFQAIQKIVEDSDDLVIILIDEVESLAHSRKSSFAGAAEPSDSIRVVNALLTHLDKIKRYPNVLILTTSNITEAIDIALVDRADIKQYIGLPSEDAIYQIFISCIDELQKTSIIWSREKLLKLTELRSVQAEEVMNGQGDNSLSYSLQLMDISKKSVGLSGRTIRKLPLMAHALYITDEVLDVKTFLASLEKAVAQHLQDKDCMEEVIKTFKKL